MTNISRDDVLHLARLSSLQLTDDEIEALRGNLASIVTYIGHLSELDTEGVEPTYQVTELENVARSDEVDTYAITPQALVSLAPDAASQQIKVPKVLSR